MRTRPPRCRPTSTLTAAERAALDEFATTSAGRWRIRGRCNEMTGAERRNGVATVRVLRRPAAERALPPPRLRFDRVALRVCGELQAAGASLLPAGVAGVVTKRAPIRVAAKTVAAIAASLRGAVTRRPRASVMEGNHVRIGIYAVPRRVRARLACFIHTHDADACRLQVMARDVLALAEPAGRAAANSLVVRTPESSASLPVYRHIQKQLATDLPYRVVFMSFGDGQSGWLA